MALYIAAKLSPEDRKSFVDWVTRPVLRVLRSDLLKSASHQVDRVHPLSNPNTNSDSGESTGVARSPYVAPAGLPNVRLGNHLGDFKSKKGKEKGCWHLFNEWVNFTTLDYCDSHGDSNSSTGNGCVRDDSCWVFTSVASPYGGRCGRTPCCRRAPTIGGGDSDL